MASDRHCLASVEKGSPTATLRTATVVGVGVRVRDGERVCACMHACVRDVFAIYDNDILPMLIIINYHNYPIFHTNQTH